MNENRREEGNDELEMALGRVKEGKLRLGDKIGEVYLAPTRARTASMTWEKNRILPLSIGEAAPPVEEDDIVDDRYEAAVMGLSIVSSKERV